MFMPDFLSEAPPPPPAPPRPTAPPSPRRAPGPGPISTLDVSGLGHLDGTALALAAHALSRDSSETTLSSRESYSGLEVLDKTPPSPLIRHTTPGPPPASELAAIARAPSFDSTPERFKPPAARYGVFGSQVDQQSPTTEKGLTRPAPAPGLPKEGSRRRHTVAPPPRRPFQVFFCADQPPILFVCSFSMDPFHLSTMTAWSASV